ncbi:MAG TPA: methyltransferase domain-containing protein [Jatrophihabitans sp.]|nr:methyltransferase domain-containing protein [Jatrophihabitans sp.]
MTVTVLPRVIPAPAGRPRRAGTEDTQRESRLIAADPTRWTTERARESMRRYADLAACWDAERGGYRPVPLDDALRRGGPLPAGRCAEVGAGTGLLTPLLLRVWPRVVSLDLSPDMLARSTARWRVRADAVRLPLATGCLAAVVLADAPLFAGEVCRVLRRDGVAVWSNALGDAAPHYVPPEDVLAALQRHQGRSTWRAVASEAGWGSWAVLRRLPN